MAFERQILGVHPDLIVEIREDHPPREGRPDARARDPSFESSQFLIPTRRDLQPDRAFLAERYEIFKKAV